MTTYTLKSCQNLFKFCQSGKTFVNLVTLITLLQRFILLDGAQQILDGQKVSTNNVLPTNSVTRCCNKKLQNISKCGRKCIQKKFLQNYPKYFRTIWATFCKKICRQNLSKIAKSITTLTTNECTNKQATNRISPTSVTRWLESFFKIWPFATIKICPKA